MNNYYHYSQVNLFKIEKIKILIYQKYTKENKYLLSQLLLKILILSWYK